jgi:hypothetical protein
VALSVRAATSSDLAGLPAIELSGEPMFAQLGIVFPPGPTTVETAIAHRRSCAGCTPAYEKRIRKYCEGSRPMPGTRPSQ